MLYYVKTKNELRFSSPYDTCDWKDIDFVIFPIFDGNGSSDSLGYVCYFAILFFIGVDCFPINYFRHYYLSLCFFEKKSNGEEEVLHIFSLDSLSLDHANLPIASVIDTMNATFAADMKKNITKVYDKVLPIKVEDIVCCTTPNKK
jgi:hypothetical protein